MTIDEFLLALADVAPQFEWSIRAYSATEFEYVNHKLIRGKLKNLDAQHHNCFCPINAVIYATKNITEKVTCNDDLANLNASIYLNMSMGLSGEITIASDLVGARTELRQRILKAVGITN